MKLLKVIALSLSFLWASAQAENLSIATGGTVQLNLMGTTNSTDCNARVTVTGGTDRVFISAQLDQQIHYTVPSGTYDLVVSVQVNRYKGFINNDPVNPDYIFDYDETVAKKDYTYR